MYLLINNSNNETLCVCSSADKLKEAVDQWVEHFRKYKKEYTLVYKIHDLDDIMGGPLEWEWAYIAKRENRVLLRQGGDVHVPRTSLFGKNLIGRKWGYSLPHS